jgi:trehalose synthase
MSRTVSGDLWWRDAIVYCLDVQTFLDTDGDGHGDLRGVSERMDYLAGMGVTCLWLMPFFPSADRDDGYDILDFYAVDPRLGTLGDFTEMVRTAGDRGIRVVADLVVNHTSIDHPWFRSARSSPDSPYRDWYVWSDEKPQERPGDLVFPDAEDSNWAYDEAAGAWYLHRFYTEQPDLNVANPQVREEISRIAGFWLQQGLAGFRVDAVPFLIEPYGLPEGAVEDPHDLLADLRAYIGRRRGDAVLLGEVNLPPPDQAVFFGAGRRELDMMFDFRAMQTMYLSLARGDAGPLAAALDARIDPPDECGWAVFARNHDELTLDQLTDDERGEVFAAFGPDPDLQLFDRGLRMRVPRMMGGDERRVRMTYSLVFSLPGAPVVFYGEEIGMGENRDIPGRLAVRSPMQWSDGPNAGFSTAAPGDLCRPVTDAPGFDAAAVNVAAQRRDEGSLLNWFERLIRRRRESPEVGHGEHRRIDAGDPAVLAHVCAWEGRSLAFVHNLAGRPARADLGDLARGGVDGLDDLFGRHDAVTEGDDGLVIDLEPYGHRWFAVRHGAAPSAELAGSSRDALYAQARDLEIPGRSDMTRDELAVAITRRSGAEG